MNTGTVVVGLVLIVVGILFGWLFCLGIILVPVGFIVMIIGLIQSEEPRTVVQYYGTPPPPAYGAPGGQVQYSADGPTGSKNFCSYCGRRIAPDAAYCPGCGRKS